ncbi:putative serine carboxypeptidase [Phaeomoniella chlamydospora]|uniref:Carboxypeptidase n=1 Tax=Phaeomoniella chlamydospora TaxID=158046 RepID=A0A0G2EAJ1_PHACM|nr:putative serine carboxypeptidase [Phaeomoniella chlamydospora]
MHLSISLFIPLITSAVVVSGRGFSLPPKPGHAPRHKYRSFSERTSRLEARHTPYYLTNATEKFAVNGTGVPDVDFDLGESYAGLLPISSAKNETRELFFWFFPSDNPAAGDEITIWLNGGPGCSSFIGLLQENGPFLWQPGTYAPVQNPYAFRNLTNMLYVEQPVGVGFTQGVPNITNEVELTQEFMGFYKNFVNTFKVHNHKVYLTGESYAGYYIPYIGDGFIAQNDTKYFDLRGALIIDPIVGDDILQQEVINIPLVDYWSNVFYFNKTFTAALHETQDACNFTSYFEKYLTFPPPGPFPDIASTFTDECDTWDAIYNAALEINPCFNPYHILDTCPLLWDVLDGSNYLPAGATIYFARDDVQEAINAVVGTNWTECSDGNVFGYGTDDYEDYSDTSDPPAQNGVLKRVIEHTQNVLITGGNLDFVIPTNGTLLAIQNMTWGGLQGFQNDPRDGEEFYVPYHPEYNEGAMAGAGIVGRWLTERGLTFATVQLSGHELPQYAPGAAYRALEVVLGRTKNLGVISDFSTQNGNYTRGALVKERSFQDIVVGM